MPSPTWEWFEYDEDELDDAERRFAEVLRRRAANWPLEPSASVIFESTADRPLIASLDLTVPGGNHCLLTFGVHMFGDRIVADEVHNQSFALPDTSTSLAMRATGDPETLGELAMDWFESIIRRPIARCVWEHAGQVYAERYQFADGYPLSQRYDKRLAPPGQPEQLIAAGHVHGKGWIQTSGLGAPGRIEPQPAYTW